MALAVMEFIESKYSLKYLNEGKTVNQLTIYFITFCEISFPTISILFIYDFGLFTASDAVSAPPILLYFIFIILSSLYLDFRLSVFSGLVAGIQHSFLVIYLLEIELGIGFGVHFGKGLIILLAGVVAGFVAKKVKESFLDSMKAKDEMLHELDRKVKERTVEVVQQKEIIEQKNKDITDSINYAKKIQEAILPDTVDIRNAFPESFVLFKPKDIVSGDFYWFNEVNDKEAVITAIDCTGHGVPGAFMSMIGNEILNQTIIEKGITKPSDILNNMHEGVRFALKQSSQNVRAKDGMDLALCKITKGDQPKLEYAGANNPLFLIKNGELIKVKPDKFPIGGEQREERREFTNNEIDVSKGDVFYIFSDGYVDQFGGPKNKKFMTARFKDLLLEVHQKEMAEQAEILEKTIEQWKGEYDQIDDICVIGVRV